MFPCECAYIDDNGGITYVVNLFVATMMMSMIMKVSTTVRCDNYEEVLYVCRYEDMEGIRDHEVGTVKD